MSASGAVALAGITALLVQGLLTVWRENRATRVGILNVCFAVIALYGYLSTKTAILVVSTEFSILLVRGAWTTLLLRLSLFVASLAGGLCWVSAIHHQRKDSEA